MAGIGEGGQPAGTRILIVDDHAVSRAGLVAVFEDVPEMQVVAQASGGREAVELYREQRPDVVLMDLVMPGMGGVEATAAIVREFPNARVIVLTALEGDEDIHSALAAGAKGYLLKDVSADALVGAVRAVRAGLRQLPSEVAERLAERISDPLDLTARELDVLRLLAKGANNSEIAGRLGLREATVKVYVNRILGKLGAGDRTEAAMTALRRGLVHLD